MKKKIFAIALCTILTVCIIALPIIGASASSPPTTVGDTISVTDRYFKIKQGTSEYNMVSLGTLDVTSVSAGTPTAFPSKTMKVSLLAEVQPTSSSQEPILYTGRFSIAYTPDTSTSSSVSWVNKYTYTTAIRSLPQETTTVYNNGVNPDYVMYNNATGAAQAPAKIGGTEKITLMYTDNPPVSIAFDKAGYNGGGTYYRSVLTSPKDSSMNEWTITLIYKKDKTTTSGVFGIQVTITGRYLYINTDGNINTYSNVTGSNINLSTMDSVVSLSLKNGQGYTLEELNEYGNKKYNEGVNAGKEEGFNEGYDKGMSDAQNLFGYIAAIGEAPANMIQEMFNFEIFGVDVSTLIFALLTTALIVVLLKKFT